MWNETEQETGLGGRNGRCWFSQVVDLANSLKDMLQRGVDVFHFTGYEGSILLVEDRDQLCKLGGEGRDRGETFFYNIAS